MRSRRDANSRRLPAIIADQRRYLLMIAARRKPSCLATDPDGFQPKWQIVRVIKLISPFVETRQSRHVSVSHNAGSLYDRA